MVNKIFLGILIITFSFGIKAQTKDISTNDVELAVNAFTKALINADSIALDKLTSNNLSYGHSGGQLQNKAAFIRSLTTGTSDFATIEITNQTIQMFGNTAIVRHNLLASTNDNGKPGSVKLSILLVWQKENDQWRLIARQAVKPPH